MLNSAMNYPYPILRNQAIDYKSGIFKADIKKTNRNDGFDLSIGYEVTNSRISELLEQGILAYALQIQCISTWYRKLEISRDNRQNIFIPSSTVHERVDLCPCIIALTNILDFSNEDFSEDFEGISFSINKGEAVAIGERQKFDAIYKNDIIKKGDPIVHFINDENCSVMFCEWEYATIQIHLPKKQYEQYNLIGEYEPWKIPLLNAIYVVPTIVQAISEVCRDELHGENGYLSRYAWYKTLKVLIAKAANGEDNKYKKLLNDPIGTAQLLLNDNSAQSLELLSKAAKQ
ncbi:hypothetical protein ABFV83_08240 [Lacrimispora sp. BS-2]|uniref:Uncharacterized protein n=1 Tax=Lacrimispora sp. BS-2 TaxID=3151850 RepID=A0AAU7PVM3_9FIRM